MRARAPLACLAGLLAAPLAAAEGPFDVVSIPSSGRTVAAELADLDGDGRTDLLEISFRGVPPDDRRQVRVYHQSPQGELPTRPTQTWPLPEGSAAYDLADVDERGGVELILLRPHGLDVVSLAGKSVETRALRPREASTLIAAADERGLDRLRIVSTDFADEPWLFVPLAGETVVFEASGAERARLRTPVRANYLIPPRDAPVAFDSELQMFVDAPRLEFGDVNGDGRTDVVAATRHELRVFLQTTEGRLPRDATQRIPLRRVSENDHIRGSGNARTTLLDMDGDGRLDLLLAHASGSITAAKTRTTIHMNRKGGWALDDPDQVFTSEGSYASDQLIDLDGDGRVELLRVEVPSTVLEIVEALVQRAVDVHASAYRQAPGGAFESDPYLTRKLAVPFDFETNRPRGFLPSLLADVNGDGHRDLLMGASGEALEVFLGGPEHGFDRAARQDLDTVGRIRFGSWNGSGGTDLVLYAPHRPEVPIRVALNRGRLPGTPQALRDAALPRVGAPPGPESTR